MSSEQLKSTPAYTVRHLTVDDYLNAKAAGESFSLAMAYGVDLQRQPLKGVVDTGLTCFGGALIEVWQSSSEDNEVIETNDGFFLMRDGDCLWGAIQHQKEDLKCIDAMTRCVDDVYRRLIAITKKQHCTHLLRLWHVFSQINEGEGEAEYYKHFCRARYDVLCHSGIKIQDSPAASAVGDLKKGNFFLGFVAATTPGQRIENPLQVSAYDYPEQYGLKQPLFSRSLIHGKQFFISGTASIKGHESLNPGDVLAQTSTTIANIEQLLKQANIKTIGPKNAVLKVYIRHHKDYATVKELLRSHWGESLPILYLQADICRRELLVEIEGFVSV